MYSIKSELKQSLSKNYALTLFKCFSSLMLALILIVAIPLQFRDVKNDRDKLINGANFFITSLLCIYAYIHSNSITEYGGKFKMLSELEKESFIKENLMSQERYLTAVSDSLIPLNIDTQFYQDIAPHNHSTQLHTTTQDAVTIDTQLITQPHNSTQLHTTTQDHEVLLCTNCGSDNLSNHGLTSKGKQRFKCNNCNKTFS
jgi:hypothetical protein